MGHKDDFTFQSYISDTLGIDCQAIISGRPVRQGAVDFFRSVMVGRKTLAPLPPGASLTDKYANRYAKWEETTAVDPPDLKRKEAYELRRQSRKKAFNKARAEYFVGKPVPAPDENAALTPRARATTPDAVRRAEPSVHLRSLLAYQWPRRSVIDLFFNLSEVERLPLADAIGPLVALARTERAAAHYPESSPGENRDCPRCHKSFDR